MHPVVHVSHIEQYIKGNQDINLNAILRTSDPSETAILKTSDPSKNALQYDVDQVMGSTEQDGKILYLVKWKGSPAKNHGTRAPLDSFY
jgi:hypothetical protein